MSKSRVKTIEVDVECDDMHCDDATARECQLIRNESFNPARALQRSFNQVGPIGDRGTDWWRCEEEPWSTIAREMIPPAGNAELASAIQTPRIAFSGYVKTQ